MFPKDAWYVACTPDEIDEKPLGRRICNESMVFFRGPEGRIAALKDFCPHRGAPLSLGRVCEGKLVCGYHGLEMGCDGKTVAMPGQRVQGFPTIPSYPVVERHGFVWVWPGDPARADTEKIYRPHWVDDPNWTFAGGLYHVRCDYRLLIDNLMDLTHETYVHANSIGQKELDEALPTTKTEGDEVVTARFLNNILPPPFWRMALRGHQRPDDQPVDRWQASRFIPPSNVLIDVGVAPAGKGGRDAPPDLATRQTVVDFITPETETSLWYFWGAARNFSPKDEALTANIVKAAGAIFDEDVQMLERQQQNLLANPDRRLLMLNIDAGGVQARRVIDRMISAEQKSVPA